MGKINIIGTIKNVKYQVKLEKDLSPTLKSLIELLLVIISLLTHKLGLNSSNSSIPPSQDTNRKKTKRKRNKRKPGGQFGHKRSSLGLVDNPDEIENLELDKRTFPHGNYHEVRYEA